MFIQEVEATGSREVHESVVQKRRIGEFPLSEPSSLNESSKVLNTSLGSATLVTFFGWAVSN